jgi:hypothetical protein
MVAKLTSLTHKIAVQLHLVSAVLYAVLASRGQSGNFWIHPCTLFPICISITYWMHWTCERCNDCVMEIVTWHIHWQLVHLLSMNVGGWTCDSSLNKVKVEELNTLAYFDKCQTSLSSSDVSSDGHEMFLDDCKNSLIVGQEMWHTCGKVLR